MSVSFRHNYLFGTLYIHLQIYFYFATTEGESMKALSKSIIILTMTASSVFAGNCAKHNKANLEAMACESGFTWNETTAECVKDTA